MIIFSAILLVFILKKAVHCQLHETTLSMLPEDVYKRLEVVPKLIPQAPQDWCDVRFPTGTKFDKGAMVAAKAIRRRPTVTWKGEPGALYTVFMYGVNKYINKIVMFADLILQDFYLHWIVVNVPGNQLSAPENKITSGIEWFEFLKPLIPPYTVTHRYVILVYKQDHPLPENGTAIYDEGFADFPSHEVFVHNETLGEPVCGNLCIIRT
ncbi:protein D3-like [Planococcus citri]|uniref:protein D3-like n=1 Tax=Planococcus citri TaxID=170843 RepID=UPI0031FA17B3